MAWIVPNLMTRAEVAERLRTTEAAITNARRAGRLVGTLIGREFHFHPDDVNAYIEKMRGGGK